MTNDESEDMSRIRLQQFAESPSCQADFPILAQDISSLLVAFSAARNQIEDLTESAGNFELDWHKEKKRADHAEEALRLLLNECRKDDLLDSTRKEVREALGESGKEEKESAY